jgi:uncharacterized protein (TIGR03067 family)
MKRSILGFLVVAAVGTAGWAEDKTDAEAKNLEGVWEVKAFERKGDKTNAPEGKGGAMVFGKDMMLTLQDPGKPDKRGRYKIDPSKSPKQLDLIQLQDGKVGTVMQAIYEVEEDALRIGFSAEGPRGKRPTEFKGDKVVILHLKRQKS